MEGMSGMLMILIMFAVMYFFMIRPENKKRKAAEAMRNSLAVGNVVTTIGGIVGTVCAVKENTIVVETGADRVRIEFTKWAVSSVGAEIAQKEKRHDKHPPCIGFPKGKTSREGVFLCPEHVNGSSRKAQRG